MTGPAAGWLADLDRAARVELARLLRRAAGRVPRQALGRLAPFATFRPEHLADPRPLTIAAEALAADARLGEALAEQAGAGLDEVGEATAAALVDRLGEVAALAALLGAGRDEDAHTLAVRRAERLAAAGAAAAEAGLGGPGRPGQGEPDGDGAAAAGQQDADGGVAEAVRDAERRARQAEEARREAERAEAAQRDRAEQAEQRAGEQARRAERAERHAEQVAQDLEAERAEHRDRAARLQRRADEAEDRHRAALRDLDAERRRRRAAEQRAEQAERAAPPPEAGEDAPQAAGVPRRLPAAEPGRPCRLPPGVAPGTAQAVRSLLRVDGLTVLLDGYNLGLHPQHGSTTTGASGARDRVRALARACAARHADLTVTVVFDGADVDGPPTRLPRGVHEVFTDPDEEADDYIVGELERLGEQPALVVTDDRELRRRAGAAGADVAGVGTLAATVDVR